MLSVLSWSIDMPVSSSSGSTDKSHSVTWSSALEAAKVESSVGCHSMEVMGCLCHVNEAMGEGVGDDLEEMN